MATGKPEEHTTSVVGAAERTQADGGMVTTSEQNLCQKALGQRIRNTWQGRRGQRGW